MKETRENERMSEAENVSESEKRASYGEEEARARRGRKAQRKKIVTEVKVKAGKRAESRPPAPRALPTVHVLDSWVLTVDG